MARDNRAFRLPLRFGQGNSKLGAAVSTFSIPAGYTCPEDGSCKSKSGRETGTITEGHKSPETDFRCYAASMECRRPTVRRARWHNYDLLRSCGTVAETAALILDSLSPFVRLLRVHESGDFWSQDYFDAWLAVARARPETTVYFYTRSLRYWVARLDEVGTGRSPGDVPNVVPTASRGGRDDHLIERHGLRSARVVFSVAQAEELGLDVDHDDSHAMRHGPDFALLLHGTQPAGTEAARAVQALRRSGFGGYGRSTRVPLPTTGVPRQCPSSSRSEP